MSDAQRPADPAPSIPRITSLSIAFPMSFETPDNRRAEDPKPTPHAPREPHRHDAGE